MNLLLSKACKFSWGYSLYWRTK